MTKYHHYFKNPGEAAWHLCTTEPSSPSEYADANLAGVIAKLEAGHADIEDGALIITVEVNDDPDEDAPAVWVRKVQRQKFTLVPERQVR